MAIKPGLKTGSGRRPSIRRARGQLHEKWTEALKSVLPITALVLVLCFFLVPVPNGALLSFVFGAALLVVGMGLFTLGTELSMSRIGQSVGAAITKSRRLGVIVAVALVMGVLITISEPDLTVLASQVPGVPDLTLILAVALGVGIFLVLALLRILFRVRMSLLLLVSYGLVFLLAIFVPGSFLAVAFDSGGVTTGPMTVPFILALGVGVASIRSDNDAENDSFGLVALCSVGPILAVMLLGIFFRPSEGAAVQSALPDAQDSMTLFQSFAGALPQYALDVALALAPIALFFVVFQLISLRMGKAAVLRIVAGLVYTMSGLCCSCWGSTWALCPLAIISACCWAGLKAAGCSCPSAW